MPYGAKNEKRVAREVPGLRAARRLASLSLRDLENQSGVSFVNIWRIESGQQRATLQTVEKLARALGVGSDELLGPPEGLPPEESDISTFVRSLNLEPEPYFTEIPIGDRRVRDLYELTYVRLRLAEQRANEGLLEAKTFDVKPFDAELSGYVRRLLAVARRVPPSGERSGLPERASRIARRAAAVLEQEAHRLDQEIEEKRAEGRRLMEAAQELSRAA
jgi:transcriptional regulator with XRE-family HTH domain